MEDSPLLPIKNKYAIIGYYVSLAGFIPLIGLPASITAFVFGIMGLNFEKTTHVPGAKAHAITAIVLGSVLGLIHLAVLVLFIGVMVADY